MIIPKRVCHCSTTNNYRWRSVTAGFMVHHECGYESRAAWQERMRRAGEKAATPGADVVGEQWQGDFTGGRPRN